MGLALAYIALAMRQSRLCWVVDYQRRHLHRDLYRGKLYMEAGLQLTHRLGNSGLDLLGR